MAKFKDFLKEMPHVKVGTKYFDFRLEKDTWPNDLLTLVASLGSKEVDELFSVLYQMQYMKMFKKRFGKLNKHDKNRVWSILPEKIKRELR